MELDKTNGEGIFGDICIWEIPSQSKYNPPTA
jgi:hypothetical protein